MRKLVALGGLLLLCMSPAIAQDDAGAPQQQSAPPPVPAAPPVKKAPPVTPTWEISGGYTSRGNYQADGTKPYYNGFYASVDRNIFHWLGAEAAFTRTSKNQGVLIGDSRVYTLMAGPAFFPFGHRKVTLFGHVLFGLGRESITYPAFAGVAQQTNTYNVNAWEVGGGLDWNKWKHWSIRLIEGDFGGANFTGVKANSGSVRISVGAVYRFGHK
jgi:opacity protein-like surface antigen